MRTMLIALGMTAASIWVGSLVCLAVVSTAATETLDHQSRVALFRRVGRLYGIVGFASLLVAIAVGLAFAWPPADMDGTVAVVFALAALLVVATVLGMAQARSMTERRGQLVMQPRDRAIAERVRRGAAIAGVLRGSLALITFVMVVLGAHLLGRR